MAEVRLWAFAKLWALL